MTTTGHMNQIISLGAGVQSSTMASMAAAGEIYPMPKCAIFADTQAEPDSVYAFLDKLEPLLPFPVYRVTAGNLATDGLKVIRSKKSGNLYQKNLIPLFIKNANGTKGILMRKCTSEYKVRVIQKKQRSLLADGELREWRRTHATAYKAWMAWKAACTAARKAKAPLPPEPMDAWHEMQGDPLVVSWIGISTDESHRVKPSREPWIWNRYPLLENNVSRAQCLAWMKRKGFDKPPRSACTFCPYHSDAEWVRLRDDEPVAFAKAVQWERDAQTANKEDQVTRGVPYLHATLVTLDKVVFRPKPVDTTAELGFNLECEGMCGV